MTSYILPSGVLVVFLYPNPFGHNCHEIAQQTRLHLSAFSAFVQDWNYNTPDTSHKHPSTSACHAWPAVTLVMSSGHHTSNHSDKEPAHITAYVCGESGWGGGMKRSNACVHIYSEAGQVDHGYRGFWIKNSNANNFQSAVVMDKLQRALENRREVGVDMGDSFLI